jgi:hypothetical protein
VGIARVQTYSQEEAQPPPAVSHALVIGTNGRFCFPLSDSQACHSLSIGYLWQIKSIISIASINSSSGAKHSAPELF